MFTGDRFENLGKIFGPQRLFLQQPVIQVADTGKTRDRVLAARISKL